MYDHMRNYHHREDYVKFRLTKMPGQDLQCPKCLWFFVYNVSETHKCKMAREESIRLFGQKYSKLDPESTSKRIPDQHQETNMKAIYNKRYRDKIKKKRKRQRSSDEWDEPSEPEDETEDSEAMEDPDYVEEPSDGEGFKPDSVDDVPSDLGIEDLIDPTKCPHCEKELCDRSSLLAHLKGVHGKEAYLKYHTTPMGPYKSKCPTCGLCFDRRIHHKRKQCLETYELAKGTEFEFEMDEIDPNNTSVLDDLDSDTENSAAEDKKQSATLENIPKRKRSVIELTEDELNFKPEECDDYQCPFCDHRVSEKQKKVLGVGNHIKAKHGILAYLKYRTTPIGSCQTQCKTCKFHYQVISSHDIRHCHKVMMMAKGTPYEFEIDQEQLDKMEKLKVRGFHEHLYFWDHKRHFGSG